MTDNFDRPIFVTGTPRSGTSMVAGTMAMCGAWTGTTVGGGPENRNGFWEHAVIREKVTKGLLRQMGHDPLGVTSLPTIPKEAASPGLKGRIRDILADDGYEGDQRWLYKGAKLVLLWPLFANAFPKAQWVVVWRDRKDIIDSCLRTSFMKQHSEDRQFWEDWAREYWFRSMQLILSIPGTVSVQAERWVVDADYIENKVREVGLTYDKDKVREFIIPDALKVSE